MNTQNKNQHIRDAHFDANGNRIPYAKWRKMQKLSHKRIAAGSTLAACALAIAMSAHVDAKTSAKQTRLAGISAYSALMIRSGEKASTVTNKQIAVGASHDQQAELEEQSREEAIFAEKQAEYQAQVVADEQAEQKRQAEEAARKAAEEAAAKAAAEAAEQTRAAAAPANVPSEANRGAHPYMPYTAVTNRGTTQYQVLNGSDAWSDPATGLRMVGDRICIAIGQGYGLKAGDKVDVVLDDGSIVKCILGDMKALVDTDPSARYQATDRNVVEMVVDYAVFSKNSAQYLSVFHGSPVKKLVKVQ